MDIFEILGGALCNFNKQTGGVLHAIFVVLAVVYSGKRRRIVGWLIPDVSKVGYFETSGHTKHHTVSSQNTPHSEPQTSRY